MFFIFLAYFTLYNCMQILYHRATSETPNISYTVIFLKCSHTFPNETKGINKQNIFLA